MAPPASSAPKYLTGKIYTLQETTTTSTNQQTSTSPSLGAAPAPFLRPAPTFCPVVETPAPPPKATRTSPPIPTLLPPQKQFNEKAWAGEQDPHPLPTTFDAGRAWPDEDYSDLIDEYDYSAKQVQQAGRRYFSFSNTPSLQAVPEESEASISAFAAVLAESKHEKWSAPLPSSLAKWSINVDGIEEMKEGTTPGTKNHGDLKKESLLFRPAKEATDEGVPGKEKVDEERFV